MRHYAGQALLTLDIRNCAIGFAVGVVAAHWLPVAHPFWAYWLVAGLGLAPLRRLRVVAMIAVGLGWGALNIGEALAQRLDASCEDADLVGRIVDLPAHVQVAGGRADDARVGPTAQRFLVQPETASCAPPGRIRLTWFEGAEVRAGERWRLHVRLRPARGTANAHGFDADRWFLRQGIVATGYVLAGSRVAATDPASIPAVREALRERMSLLPLVNAGVLAALTLGDSGSIPRQEMARYQRTGTIHLLVISGLHVGIVTALGFLLGRAVGLVFGVSAKASGVVAALLLAAGYVLLAGAGLSLLRAFVMATTTMLALVAGRSVAPSTVFAYALAIVLAADPMAPLATGFWLSFGAVAVLLGFFAPRPRLRSWLASAALAQLAIALVFAPATVGITGLIHPLSILVNLTVVPLVTMLVVPLALAGSLLSFAPVGAWLLTGADFCISVVAEVLTFADRVTPIHVADPKGWLVWLVAAAAACLLPVSRLAALALLLALAASLTAPWWSPKPVAHGEVAVTVLDVGQGTAVLVTTAGHAMLYDTGPAFATGSDAATSVVLPMLRGAGHDALDLLLLSHGDLDHVGGTAALLAGIDIRRVLVGEPVAGVDALPCRAGARWRWDGVDFSVLSPPRNHGFNGNDASCVLLIETATARVLLAGDIERTVERALAPPPVDLLLVPHHGSATSSTVDFVAAVRPKFAIVTAGFDNRFGHPHPAVVERYRDAGAHVLTTAVSGALRWRSDEPCVVVAERCREASYWRTEPAAANAAYPRFGEWMPCAPRGAVAQRCH